MEKDKMYYLGVVTKVVEEGEITKEYGIIEADIPGVIKGIRAFPKRSELSEPKEGDAVLLLNLDPVLNSYWIYEKLKENNFIGIRSAGKMVSITPNSISLGVFEKDEENGGGYEEDEMPCYKSFISLEDSGAITVKSENGASIYIDKDGSCTINSDHIKITGGKLEVNGVTTIGDADMSSSSVNGPFCSPFNWTCPYMSTPHVGPIVKLRASSPAPDYNERLKSINYDETSSNSEQLIEDISTQGSNSGRKVTLDDYKQVAKLLGVEPEALMAVVSVETGGRSGFLNSGKPKILFEAKYMYNQLKKAGRNDLGSLLSTYPNIISTVWDKSLYKGGEGEWDRLNQAKSIDSSAANQSASWGIFQIMGANYKACGCSSIEEFVQKMCDSEYSQFLLGVNFIKNTNKVGFLKSHNWAGFAKAYNGSGYKKNNYDTKLANAYNKYKKQNLT